VIRSPRLSWAVALLGAALALSGCSGSGASKTSASRTASAAPTVSAVPSDSATPGIRVDLPVTRTIKVSTAVAASFAAAPSKVDVPASLSIDGLGQGGNLLVERIPALPKGSDASEITRAATLGTWNARHFSPVATADRETKGPLRGRMRQITNAVQAGNRLIWVETPSTDVEYNEWSLRTTVIGSHRVREIAHSRILKKGRVLDVTGGTYPVVVGDWVYWAAAVPTVSSPSPSQEADWAFNILRSKLSRSSAVETFARNAVMPTPLDGALVYASYSKATPDVYEIHQREVAGTQTDRVLVRGYRSGTSWITNLASSGKLVVWTAQSPGLKKEGWVPDETAPGVMFILDVSTGALTKVITKDEAGGEGSIAFTRRGVVWGNGSGNGDAGEYVLDLITGKLQKLGAEQGYSEVMANPDSDQVMWVPKSSANNIVWKVATLS